MINPARKQQSTILITDDDPSFLLTLRQFLERLDYHVVEARDGAEALKVFEQESPDLILMDGMMPGMDGIGTCARLKERPEAKDIPVMIITGIVDEFFVDRAFAAGASDYLAKPILWPVLRNRIHYLLQVNEAKQTLRESEARKSAILNTSPDCIITVDHTGRILDFNPAAETTFGYKREQAIGQMMTDMLMPAAFRQQHRQLFNRYAAHSGSDRMDRRVETTALRSNGEEFPVEVAVSIIEQEDQYPIFTAIMQDISARKAAEEQLHLAASVFENTAEGIMITDADNLIRAVNPVFCKITGYDEQEVLGKDPSILRSDQHDEHFFREMWAGLSKKGTWEGEVWNRRKDGEIYPARLSINTIRDQEKNTVRYVALLNDITQRKEYEEKIWYQANFDSLTGLPNRTLLMDRLQHDINNAHRQGKPLALMFIDLDGFKVVNDTLGHPAGDHLLQEAANRLLACLREGDTIARLGGDEFTIVLPNIESPDQAETVAENLLKQLSEPFQLADQQHHISGSIGITLYPDDGNSSEMLLRNGDTAMYRAKDSGRNTFVFFTEEMNQHAIKRMTLERELRQALQNDELEVHYQPFIDLISNSVIGAEALVRWRHPQRGMVPPDEFIPLAEETGLIAPLGERVLHCVTGPDSLWRREGLANLRIAVNVSTRQFQERSVSFVDRLQQIIDQARVPPGLLEVEITESLLMENLEMAKSAMHRIRELGIPISLDDFGTGYSSLSYLRRFPVDLVKIDRSFIQDVMTDPEDASLVQAIIAMAHVLKLKVIAEGIETPDQLDFLRRSGCDICQGYYFSRPLPADEFEHFFLQQQGKLAAAD